VAPGLNSYRWSLRSSGESYTSFFDFFFFDFLYMPPPGFSSRAICINGVVVDSDDFFFFFFDFLYMPPPGFSFRNMPPAGFSFRWASSRGCVVAVVTCSP